MTWWLIVLTPPRGGLAWWLIALVVACDQVTKGLMLSWLEPHVPHAVIPDLLNFTLKGNRGVAFSLFAEHGGVLTVVTSVAVVIIGWWAWGVPRSERVTRNAFGMILGGALGNLIDRYARGGVVDFIDVILPGFVGKWHTGLFGTRHFATFNLADTAICLGMGLLILTLVLPRGEGTTPEKGQSRT